MDGHARVTATDATGNGDGGMPHGASHVHLDTGMQPIAIGNAHNHHVDAHRTYIATHCLLEPTADAAFDDLQESLRQIATHDAHFLFLVGKHAPDISRAIGIKQGETGTMRMRSCTLTDSAEGWQDDAYIQELTFQVRI